MVKPAQQVTASASCLSIRRDEEILDVRVVLPEGSGRDTDDFARYLRNQDLSRIFDVKTLEISKGASGLLRFIGFRKPGQWMHATAHRHFIDRVDPGCGTKIIGAGRAHE